MYTVSCKLKDTREAITYARDELAFRARARAEGRQRVYTIEEEGAMDGWLEIEEGLDRYDDQN